MYMVYGGTNYLIQEVIWVGTNPPKLGNVNKYE